MHTDESAFTMRTITPARPASRVAILVKPERQTQTCSPVTDRVCELCAEGSYDDDGDASTACVACGASCEPGYTETQACTPTSNASVKHARMAFTMRTITPARPASRVAILVKPERRKHKLAPLLPTGCVSFVPGRRLTTMTVMPVQLVWLVPCVTLAPNSNWQSCDASRVATSNNDNALPTGFALLVPR